MEEKGYGEGPNGDEKIAGAPIGYLGDILFTPLLGKMRLPQLLLVQIQVGLYSASNSTTYHGVVTNTQEAHHLNVSGN